MKRITVKWLKKHNACVKGIEWFKKQTEKNPINLINWAIKNKKHLNWANWLIVRLMKYKQYVSYAIYAAEQVLYLFQKKYPEDKRPIEAIQATKKCLKYASQENKAAASSAAYASAADAYTAAAAASSAADVSAAYVAAAYAAAASAAAADAASAAAADASAAAAYAASAAANRKKMQIKILKYGLQLITGEQS